MFEPPRCTAHALREIAGGADPEGVVERVRAGGFAWLLDSALHSPRLGRYSFAGADPYLVLRTRGRRVELECRRAVHAGLARGSRRLVCDVLDAIRHVLPPPPASAGSVLPFVGGAVGYLGYELAEQFDAFAFHGRDDLGLPDAVLLFVDALVAFDHLTDRAWVSALGFGSNPREARARAERAADRLSEVLSAPTAAPRDSEIAALPDAPIPDVDAATYAKAVDRVLEEIAAGNVYQACYTARVERDFGGDPWDLHRVLRRLNPAPFGCFLELPELCIVGSSPERFLRVTPGGEAESRPIKGTASRGRHPAEDAARRAALEGSAKDRAENLMIVDLVRNDLGRVCEPGSVSVPELMAVESYASLFQMVSTVRGVLRRDCDALDLVRATFPPGSMTGAPKIAAMRLLDRLEPVRRGVYSGAVGYFDVRGGADLSVAIRTILLRAGRAYLHAGGGIVADSEPLAEYREARQKLEPLLLALEEARHGSRTPLCSPAVVAEKGKVRWDP